MWHWFTWKCQTKVVLVFFKQEQLKMSRSGYRSNMNNNWDHFPPSCFHLNISFCFTLKQIQLEFNRSHTSWFRTKGASWMCGKMPPPERQRETVWFTPHSHGVLLCTVAVVPQTCLVLLKTIADSDDLETNQPRHCLLFLQVSSGNCSRKYKHTLRSLVHDESRGNKQNFTNNLFDNWQV